MNYILQNIDDLKSNIMRCSPHWQGNMNAWCGLTEGEKPWESLGKVAGRLGWQESAATFLVSTQPAWTELWGKCKDAASFFREN